MPPDPSIEVDTAPMARVTTPPVNPGYGPASEHDLLFCLSVERHYIGYRVAILIVSVYAEFLKPHIDQVRRSKPGPTL